MHVAEMQHVLSTAQVHGVSVLYTACTRTWLLLQLLPAILHGYTSQQQSCTGAQLCIGLGRLGSAVHMRSARFRLSTDMHSMSDPHCVDAQLLEMTAGVGAGPCLRRQAPADHLRC